MFVFYHIRTLVKCSKTNILHINFSCLGPLISCWTFGHVEVDIYLITSSHKFRKSQVSSMLHCFLCFWAFKGIVHPKTVSVPKCSVMLDLWSIIIWFELMLKGMLFKRNNQSNSYVTDVNNGFSELYTLKACVQT